MEEKKNKTLYIIGNGFDLHHGLKTGYSNFKEWLEERDYEIVLSFENDEYLINPIGDNWSDIESHLEVNYEDLIDGSVDAYIPNLDDESDSRWHNLTIDVELKTKIAKKITHELFYEWISSIDTSHQKKKLELNNDLYVSFNYTKTLEDIYGIQPLHIHGIIGNSIQFGNFNNNPVIIKKLLIEKYKDYEWFNVSIEPGIDELIEYCRYTYKKLDDNITLLKNYLGNNHIDKVIIMGNSFLGMDFPYYEEVFLNYKCKWVIYCHHDADYKNAIHLKEKYGLDLEIVSW